VVLRGRAALSFYPQQRRRVFMSTISTILERLEHAAKRLEMSVEDAVLVLEGKHPTHSILVEATTETPVAPPAMPAPAPVVAEPAPETPAPAEGA